MGDRNHIAHGRPLEAEDDITVVFYKVDSRGDDDNNSSSGRGGDHDDDELPAERVRLHESRGVLRRSNDDEEKAEKEEEGNDDARRTDTGHGDGHLPEDGERKRLFCQPASCVSNEPPSSEDGTREGIGARAPAIRVKFVLKESETPVYMSLKCNIWRKPKNDSRLRGLPSVPRPRYTTVSRDVCQ